MVLIPTTHSGHYAFYLIALAPVWRELIDPSQHKFFEDRCFTLETSQKLVEGQWFILGFNSLVDKKRSEKDVSQILSYLFNKYPHDIFWKQKVVRYFI